MGKILARQEKRMREICREEIKQWSLELTRVYGNYIHG